MNRLAYLCLILGILCSGLSATAYDFEVDGIYYEMVSMADKTCKVVKGDKLYEGDIVIPSSITYKSQDISIVALGSQAFLDCSDLTSLVIPNSVTTIGNQACQGCISLKSIVLPNSIMTLGFSTFSGCISLESISIPNSVTAIGSYAFSSCSSLKSIVLSNSILEVFNNTFSQCTSLQSISIPNGVIKIGEYAFSGCSSMTSIVIPDSVTEIGEYAFYSCTSLASVKLSNSLKKLLFSVFRKCEKLASLTIPSSLNMICLYSAKGPGDKAVYNNSFESCNELKKLEIMAGDIPLWASQLSIIPIPDVGNIYNDVHWWNPLDNSIIMPNIIETLYIDRELDGVPDFRDLVNLQIGPHVSVVDVKLSECTNLSDITSYAINPPILFECTTQQYMDIEVRVPLESLEEYKNHGSWKNFWNIEGFDSSSIENMTNDPSTPSRTVVTKVNLNGQPVSEDYKGIVIVRFSDGSTKKIIQ